MRFLADECCDALVTRTLRDAGHDVLSILETMPGTVDDVVLKLAFQEARIVLTEDRDFCEMVFRDRKQTRGIILIRIPDNQRQEKAKRIIALVTGYTDVLQDAMTTLTVNSIRVRSLVEKPPVPED